LNGKASTIRSYVPTIGYATRTFREKPVRRLSPDVIATFNQLVRGQGLTASTRAKHLRVLGACLQSAVQHGYASTNPVRELPRAEKPRAERSEAAYFENDEIPRLFADFQTGMVRRYFSSR
jgi:site-specific recombinase XerD